LRFIYQPQKHVIKITFNLLAKQSNQSNLYLGNVKDFFVIFSQKKTTLKILKISCSSTIYRNAKKKKTN